MLPGWIPRFHPVWWIIIIVLVVAVVRDPTGMGARAGDMIHAIEHWIGQQRTVWEQRLDRMEAYVKTLAEKGAKHGK